MKSKTGKILVAIMAIAVILMGSAIVLSDSNVEAADAPLTTMPETGTLTEETTVDLAAVVTGNTFSYTAGSPVTLTVNYKVTADKTTMFKDVDFTVGKNVTVIFNMTADQKYTNCHIFSDCNLTINDNGAVEFRQSADAAGVTWWDSADGTADKLEMTSSESKLTFNGANGISGVEATVNGTVDFKSTTSDRAAVNFAKLTVTEDATVKNTAGTSVFIYFDGEVNNSGTIDAGSSYIQMGSAANITNNETGRISASEITNLINSTAIVNKGTLNANIQIGDADAGYSYLSGAVSSALAPQGSSTVKIAAGAVLENVTVNPGVTLDLQGNVTVKGDMRLYGTLTTAAGNEFKVEVPEGASLTAYANSQIQSGVTVVGDGEIDISYAMSTMRVDEDVSSNLVYSQSQTVIITESLTIKSSYSLTVYGQLIINEGVTLTIEDNATLKIGEQNGVKALGMTVNGDIEVEEGGIINVGNADKVDVTGQIYSNGTVQIYSTVNVLPGGVVEIDDAEGSSIYVEQGMTVEADGELIVASDMHITQISNRGTITINGANIIERSVINMTAAGAVVDIRSFTQDVGKSLIINDVGLFLYKNENGEDVSIAENERNSIAFDGATAGTSDSSVAVSNGLGIRGITITSVLETEKVDKDTTNYYNSFVIGGSPSMVDETVGGDFNGTYTIIANAYNTDKTNNTISSIEVPGSLTFGRNVQFILNGGDMYVDGSITATADGNKITSNGQIYVDGMITIAQKNGEIASGINAFFYQDQDNFYYTALNTAIDNGADDIDYLGNVKVLENVTIPADTTLSDGKIPGSITIGSTDARDVTVTVNDGATVRNCIIKVMGTLVFDNNKGSNKSVNGITSDVIIDEEPKRTYTNVYTALEGATDGSTITIAPNTYVYLDKDAEIRQTITLEIPTGSGLYLYNDVTLTVNGTLRNSGDVDNAYPIEDSPINAPNTDSSVCDGFKPVTDAATDDRQPAAIVANGTVMSMDQMEYSHYYIAGAYYQMVNDQGSWYYITPVAQAAAVSNDVENGVIAIYGDNTAGDVAFTGDEDQPVTVTITEQGTLTAGTITLDRAGIVADGAFTGTVASAAGSVEAVNATGFSVIDTYVNETEITYLTGNPVIADDEQKDSSITVATGTINAGQINLNVTGASNFDIAEGATLMVAGQYENANAEIEADKMTVNGTLVATDNGNVNVTTMTVRGTFTVEAADGEAETDAGTATIGTLYVGIAVDKKTSKYVDASAATVTADKIDSLTNVYVSGESTVTGKLIENKNTTEFYVEDALWMTVYTTVNMDVNTIIPGDLVNSEFLYWADANGEEIEDSTVDVGDEEAVYANLNYDIYTVTVYADPGITAVYIDGKLMTSGIFRDPVNGMWAEGFQLNVAAGEHEITYKLGNYYSGEAKMTVNGESVTGNTFTTSGTTTADKTVTIYLQGVEASAPETPSTSGSDNGMGLTDYLLIILVILIVIMAIMVALRLMRS